MWEVADWKYGTMIQHESGVIGMYISRDSRTQTHHVLLLNRATPIERVTDLTIGLWHEIVET